MLVDAEGSNINIENGNMKGVKEYKYLRFSTEDSSDKEDSEQN